MKTHHIEIFPTRRWPGYMGLVWYNGQVHQVLWERDQSAAWLAAREWVISRYTQDGQEDATATGLQRHDGVRR